MTEKQNDAPFFVGYLPAPRRLLPFLAAVAIAFLAGSALLAYSIAFSQTDPGDGSFRFDYGRQTVQGVLELTPAPILHVTRGSEQIGEGETLILSGQGKNGAVERAEALQGQLVSAAGVLLERGDLNMLQLAGGNAFSAAEDQSMIPEIPEPQAMGRWQLTGEICDGKCTAGAMRPGRGIAHRACANLCILGGIPAVFVSTQPVEGDEFLLITGMGEDVIPPGLLDYIGLFVTLEGDVTRHGDLLALTVDPSSVEIVE